MTEATSPPDPMRAVAWICIVAGVLIALAYPLWIASESSRLDDRLRSAAVFGSSYYGLLAKEQAELGSGWAGVGVGAAVTAFGLLLLAIRRPGAPAVLCTLSLLAGCAMHYPPGFSPARSQSAAQQDADSRDCDREVHSAGSVMLTGWATAWSEKERDGFIACMQARGYTADKR